MLLLFNLCIISIILFAIYGIYTLYKTSKVEIKIAIGIYVGILLCVTVYFNDILSWIYKLYNYFIN